MRFYFRRALEACADAPGPGASRRDDGLGVGASHTDAHNDAPGPGASRRDDGLGVGASQNGRPAAAAAELEVRRVVGVQAHHVDGSRQKKKTPKEGGAEQDRAAEVEVDASVADRYTPLQTVAVVCARKAHTH